MNREQIRKRAARILNQLASDESTIISGQITETAFNEYIDDTDREDLYPILSNYFPDDYSQWTYPQATYTATSTIASVSTTTLNVNDSIFQNSMEGLYIENITQDEKIKIATYVSATQVVMESTVAAWDPSDTIYVLGNIYTFGGDASNIKEIVKAEIKYTGNEERFINCDIRDEDDVIETNLELYSKSGPIAFPTTVTVSGVLTPAIGFLPHPDSYAGKWRTKRIRRPAALTDSTEPVLNRIGISDQIINGTVAKCFRALGMFDKAAQFEELDRRTGQVLPKGTLAKIATYRPKSRGKPQRIRPSGIYMNMIRRTI
jgi:hypothetical protein